jgi:amino acid transporter
MDLFLVYLVCFGVGLLFTIISAFMADVFGGHDAAVDAGHVDVGAAGAGAPDFSPLSPTTIASFVTAFGGFGMVFAKIEALRNPWINVPLSLLAGFIVAGGVFVLFRFVFRRTQSSSEAHVAKLVGTTGTISTPIPANGVGEISYVSGGSRYTAPARSLNGKEIANGQAVKIARIVGSQFYVEAI